MRRSVLLVIVLMLTLTAGSVNTADNLSSTAFGGCLDGAARVIAKELAEKKIIETAISAANRQRAGEGMLFSCIQNKKEEPHFLAAHSPAITPANIAVSAPISSHSYPILC